VIGVLLTGYAFLRHPLVDLLTMRWPSTAAFAISPCPLTLFPIGLMLFSAPRLRSDCRQWPRGARCSRCIREAANL
jgi:hypothetical protein